MTTRISKSASAEVAYEPVFVTALLRWASDPDSDGDWPLYFGRLRLGWTFKPMRGGKYAELWSRHTLEGF